MVHAVRAASWLTGTLRWAAALIWRQSVLQAISFRRFGQRLCDRQNLKQQGRVHGEYSMQQHPFARGGFGEVWRATKPGWGPAHCCPCSQHRLTCGGFHAPCLVALCTSRSLRTAAVEPAFSKHLPGGNTWRPVHCL